MARPAIQPAATVISVIPTQSDIVPTPPEPLRAPRKVHLAWAAPLVGLSAVAILAVLAIALLPSNWFVAKPNCDGGAKECKIQFGLVPADAQPVEPRLKVKGVTTYPTEGQIYFVTIREPELTVMDYLVTHHQPSVRFMSYTDKYGNQTEEQLLQSGQRQMTGAKDRATYVALKAAGFDVTRKNGPAIIDYIVCAKANAARTKCDEEAPAAKVLKPNDTIISVNGTKITTLDDISPALKSVKAGDTVELAISRDGKESKVSVQTIQAPGETAPRTIIGFAPVDTTTVSLPTGLQVDFSTEGIGGPSAGLAFTLTLIDTVTQGNLMGNNRIAVTGEIDIDGKVGAIGGLNSKAKAVQQTGVKYFLVPASQPKETDGKPNPDSIAAAQRVVGDSMQIIPVDTLDDALAALRRLGGDPLPAKK
jgi:PDZ domain-containing protein